MRRSILWARENEMPIAVRSGGHNYAGYSSGPGLVVDLGGMRQVAVDDREGTVSVGSGARNTMIYSDFFDLGWEAVGDLDPNLIVEPVWKEPFRQGIIFYLRDDVIRGVLLWNSWGLVDWARGLIREAKPMSIRERAARIPSEEAGTAP